MSLIGRSWICCLPNFIVLSLPAISADTLYQARKERDTCRKIIEFYILVGIVCQTSTCAQSIDSGNAQDRSIVGIRSSTAAQIFDLQSQFFPCRPRHLHQRSVALRALKRHAAHFAAES